MIHLENLHYVKMRRKRLSLLAPKIKQLNIGGKKVKLIKIIKNKCYISIL